MGGDAARGSMPPIESLLPHRGGMLLLRRVLRWSERSVEAIGQVPAGPLGSPGAVPWIPLIEMAAQAAAAHGALGQAGPGAAPRIGYLVGLRDLRGSDGPPPGADLLVVAHLVGTAGGLRRYEVSVESGGVPLLSGTLSAFERAPGEGA